MHRHGMLDEEAEKPGIISFYNLTAGVTDVHYVPTPALVAKLNNGLWQSSLAVLTQSAVNAFVPHVLYKNGSYNRVLEFVEHIVASTLRQHKFGESHQQVRSCIRQVCGM